MKALFQRAPRAVPDLSTGALRLVAITPAMLRAEQERDLEFRALKRLLGAKLTEEWPPEHWEPHVLEFISKQYDEHPASAGWHRYVLLTESDSRGCKEAATLIGAVGGFPKLHGDVEIGYSTLPAFQRRGHGTAAAQKLVEWLLRRKGVRSVSAQTFLRLPESIKVMERCGMRAVGAGDDPESIRYRRER